MTFFTDILGRPPVMHALEHSDPEIVAGDDWRGEHFLRIERSEKSVAEHTGETTQHQKEVGRDARRAKVRELFGKGVSTTDMQATSRISPER